MSEKTINNLKHLREIKMDATRQSRQRELLLSQIQGKVGQPVSSRALFWYFLKQQFVFKSLAYVTAVLAVLIMGTGYTMSAASHSLPGNTFYPVKLSWEKLQLSLVPDDVDRTKKQIEFADRRLSELSSLTQEQVSPVAKQEQVAQAVKYFNDSIREVKSSLEKAATSETNGDDKLIEIAQLVNDKSQDFAKTLAGHYEDLPVTVKSVVEKEVADVKYQSLELLIDRYSRHSQDISKETIVSQLEDRIIGLGEWASKLEDEELNAEALAKLRALEEFVEQDKFKEVLVGIDEFVAWQNSLKSTEQEEVNGKVLGATEELEIGVATSTTTSTVPIIQAVPDVDLGQQE